jgi:hypothetical protein
MQRTLEGGVGKPKKVFKWKKMSLDPESSLGVAPIFKKYNSK